MSRSISNSGVRQYVRNMLATAVKNTTRKALIKKLKKKEEDESKINRLKIHALADRLIKEGLEERNELSKLQKELLNTGSASFSLSSRSKSAPKSSRSRSASKNGGKRRYTKKRRSTK
jgi:hypothetical protein